MLTNLGRLEWKCFCVGRNRNIIQLLSQTQENKYLQFAWCLAPGPCQSQIRRNPCPEHAESYIGEIERLLNYRQGSMNVNVRVPSTAWRQKCLNTFILIHVDFDEGKVCDKDTPYLERRMKGAISISVINNIIIITDIYRAPYIIFIYRRYNPRRFTTNEYRHDRWMKGPKYRYTHWYTDKLWYMYHV